MGENKLELERLGLEIAQPGDAPPLNLSRGKKGAIVIGAGNLGLLSNLQAALPGHEIVVVDDAEVETTARQLGKKDELSIEEFKQMELEKYNRLERGGSAKKPHHNRAYHKRKKPGKKTHRKRKK